MSEQEIERGDEVQCLTTGLVGIATGECFDLQGLKRFDVQPPVDKDNKMQSGWVIDVIGLKLLSKRKVKALPPIKVHVDLGDQVEDTISEFKGVITGKTICLNGCTRVLVQPKVNDKGELPKPASFDVGRLRAIQKVKVEQGQRETGGPIEQSGRE